MSTHFDKLSAKGMHRVSSICDEYEAAWTQEPQSTPNIFDFVRKVQSTPRDSLLDLKRAVLEQLLPIYSCNEPTADSKSNWLRLQSRCPEELFDVLNDYRRARTESDHGLGVVSKYQLLEEIGRGGMGVVYKARQVEGVERIVALKVLDVRSASHNALQRFEFEGQALASLEHDRIAKVFDTGITESGKAFIAMELVKGVPATEYCQKHNLDVRERLCLLINICRGIEHAHQKGIVHRDLKPANILVSTTTDQPVVKIIDFGLARSMKSEDQLTEFGHLLGTLEYLSPEQASLDPERIDTRTDVYGLGVILYELITGSTPIERTVEGMSKYQDILQAIQIGHFEPPSQRVTRTHSNRPKSYLNAVEVSQELDWIAAKALAVEASRRYGSVVELAQDLERFLKKEPLIAGPPSVSYRLRKFAIRHWKANLVAVVLLVGLIVFSVSVTYFVGELQARSLELEKNNVALAISEQKAQAAKQISEENKRKALRQSNLAMSVLESFVVNLHVALKNIPASSELRQRLLASAGGAIDQLNSGYLDNAEASDVKFSILIDSAEMMVELLSHSRNHRIVASDLLGANTNTPLEGDTESVDFAFSLVEEAERVLTEVERSRNGTSNMAGARIQICKGDLYAISNKWEEAQRCYRLASKFLEDIPATEEKSSEVSFHLSLVDLKIADAHFDSEKYTEAFEFCDSALQHLEKCDDQTRFSFAGIRQVTSVMSLSAKSSLHMGRVVVAVDQLSRCIVLLERSENSFEIDLSQDLYFNYVTAAWIELHRTKFSIAALFSRKAMSRYERLRIHYPHDLQLLRGRFIAEMCLLEEAIRFEDNSVIPKHTNAKVPIRSEEDLRINFDYPQRVERAVSAIYATLDALYGISPNDAFTIRGHAMVHYRLGAYHLKQGHTNAAIYCLLRAESAIEDQLQSHDGALSDLFLSVRIRLEVAESYVSSSQNSKASEVLEKVSETLDRITESPEFADDPGSLENFYETIAELRSRLNDD